MATIENNDKGFKVIKTSLIEMASVYGISAICDSCNNPDFEGYLICVLNQWFCPKCYNEWLGRAKNYPDDRAIEERNFKAYSEIFKV